MTRQKGTEDLNKIINQRDLIDIKRLLSTREYTFLSNEHGTFSRIDHNVRRKINKSNKVPFLITME